MTSVNTKIQDIARNKARKYHQCTLKRKYRRAKHAQIAATALNGSFYYCIKCGYFHVTTKGIKGVK